MPGRLKMVDLEKKEELEPMLASDPTLLEEGLVLVGRQMPTDSGPLDILAVDSDGVLVVIELKATVDEGQLVQGLRYYDWVASNTPWIANAYPEKGIDAKEPPRLMLVAPNFDETTKRAAKYVDVELNLKEYLCVQLPDDSRNLIFRDLSIPSRTEPPKVYSIPEKLERIQDEIVDCTPMSGQIGLRESGGLIHRCPE